MASIDWHIPREGVYRFRRVSYATRQEIEELSSIEPGGTITRNTNTDLKESGKLTAVGPLSIGDDLIRIYYVVEDDDGGEEAMAIATMHASVESSTYTSATETCTVTLYSALLTLQGAELTASLTIPSGTVAVSQAAALITGLGLPVIASPSAKALTADRSYDAGSTYLKVVNDLLDFAGYWSALVDGWGRVVLAPYEAPADRSSVWDFKDGENCIYLPDVSTTTDAFSVPNVCILTSSTSGAGLIGTYTNADPASPYSTVSRGRSIAMTDTVSDAVDQADLVTRAKIKLATATSATEITTIKHAYAPVSIGDVVGFAWGRHSLACDGSVQSQDISLVPSATTTTVLKRIWR